MACKSLKCAFFRFFWHFLFHTCLLIYLVYELLAVICSLIGRYYLLVCTHLFLAVSARPFLTGMELYSTKQTYDWLIDWPGVAPHDFAVSECSKAWFSFECSCCVLLHLILRPHVNGSWSVGFRRRQEIWLVQKALYPMDRYLYL
jgi:hypothetical protein